MTLGFRSKQVLQFLVFFVPPTLGPYRTAILGQQETNAVEPKAVGRSRAPQEKQKDGILRVL